ncbi:PDZ domain-containing protein [Rubrobacter taiwanensis]|uniref:PDZ domain-containing protein n=1 Tax=Rubrobacter taiwanensis TaxID=185139 RepID=A0A4R1BFV6_9ACTN|nr:trypsin-like peptidase domain-containing protein [Rubrobacter taiwanensis]TCJ16014.1 PDZ domain-containing protein [Rubrobacter taiwanensis]
MKLARLVSLLAVVVLFLGGCELLTAQDPAQERAANVVQSAPPPAAEVPEDEPVARVASQVGPSVVQVNVEAIQLTPFGPQSREGLGSGVIYREDGYIITNAHVVGDAGAVNVAFADGSTERGEVVGTDPFTDLAVVRVDRNGLPAAAFADSGEVVVGQLAVAIGSPSGFQSTVTSGVVSGLNREIPAEFTQGVQSPALVDLIQTDAAISPGSSGGALANREGEVIGINVAYLPQTRSGAPVEGIGFAIPSTTAASVADQIIETGEAVHPFLGIAPVDLTPEIAERFGIPADSGVIVAEVVPDSPADEAGLRREDVITAVDGTRIEGSGDLFAVLREYRPGDTVQLTVVRDGSEQTVELTLAERTS